MNKTIVVVHAERIKKDEANQDRRIGAEEFFLQQIRYQKGLVDKDEESEDRKMDQYGEKVGKAIDERYPVIDRFFDHERADIGRAKQ